MKWNLTYLFESQEAYNKAFEELLPYLKRFAEYQGKLENEENFKSFFLLTEEFEEKLCRVYQYASLKSDLNKKRCCGISRHSEVRNAS